jgi:T6SS, Phospholipase effector Tle1-like, catalytic domain
MLNLVVCCDGTWNTPDEKHDGVPVPTNVVRLYNAVADRDGAGNPQPKYYHPGVGTDGTWWQKVLGGSVGVGLDKNIMSAYRWLGAQYQPGDRLFLFGFSRGAFTVRSLAGMIAACGLLDLSGLPDPEVWNRVEVAYRQGYRNKQPVQLWAAGWNFHQGDAQGESVPIHFLGVWDTVGALGIPNDLAILNLLDDPKKYAFHDTDLSSSVLNARHAVALDEERASFTPSLWAGIEGDARIKQFWFPGVHSDVGGGYPEKGLSDGALQWMMDEAGQLGLSLHPGMSGQVRPDPTDVLHDCVSGVFKAFRTQPRSAPPVTQQNPSGTVHPSALQRQRNPPIAQAPYRPTILLGPGEETSFPIYAAQHWNGTGLYLEAGARYAFTATGEWMDAHIKCGPTGPQEGQLQLGELLQHAGSLLGDVEAAYKNLTNNPEADFIGTKREEAMPWFSLVGVVANGGNPQNDGSPEPHETFMIGNGCEHPAQPEETISKPGYLYCFANDAWHFYGNNRGSVMLTVRRLV